MKRNCPGILASVGLAVLLGGASPVRAQSLGNAASYAVLGGSAVTVGGGGATINGDLGVSPGTSITGPANVAAPFGIHNNDGSAIAAQTSTTALFTALGAGGATPLLAELGNTSVGPGIYSFSTTANIAANQTLTLNGAGVYIFRVGSAITANVGSNVVLAGADPCNVFWQVNSAATLNGGNFVGTVVAQAGVTLGVGADLTGRALTTTPGTVVLSGGNTVGGCSAAAPPPPVSTRPTIGKVFFPTRIGVGGVSRLIVSLINPNATAATLTAAFTDVLPGGLVVAAVPNASTTCAAGAVSSTGNSVTLGAGAVIPASGFCVVSVDVTGAAAGSFVNRLGVGVLTTNHGTNSNAVNAPLTITAALPPGVPPPLPPGEIPVVPGVTPGVPVPTLPGWAMIMLAALLALAGFAAVRRRAA